MRKSLTRLPSLLCALALGGCLSTGLLTGGGTGGPAPSWVLNPPEDSGSEWYGVGEGPDREIARRTALKDVATKLRVSISGKLDSQVTDSNGKVDRQARSRVSEEVARTEFRNFSIEKTEQRGKSFYVLVKVDRPSFVADIRARLEPLDAEIDRTVPSLDQASPLERFIGYRRLLPTVDKASAQAELLLGAENDGTANTSLRRYAAIRQSADDARTGLVFKLQAAAQDADVAAAVGTFANENGMRAASTGGTAGTVLAVKVATLQDDIGGFKIVRLTVSLNVRDEAGRSVASRDHEVSGSSRYDYKTARQNAVEELLKVLRSEGPLTGLGFAGS